MDLGKSGIHLANRPASTGTRLLFDRELRKAHLQGDKIEGYLNELSQMKVSGPVKDAAKSWIESMDDAEASRAAAARLREALGKSLGDSKADDLRKNILDLKDYLVKKSVWVFGIELLSLFLFSPSY